MGTLLLNQIKKQACSFLQGKYKTARLALTDVTPVELLAEEATNNDPWGPDAKTMTTIAEASFEVDDYWRIVDILHARFDGIDWKQWRQCYKSLVLLEFLITHGPEEFVEEFQCDTEIIAELGKFQYIDEKGFNWGANMQQRSDHILQLLEGGIALKEARLKALKITKEIQGFGNFIPSPSSSSTCSASTPDSSKTNSSFGSFSSSSSPFCDKSEKSSIQQHLLVKEGDKHRFESKKKEPKQSHIWNSSPIEETGSLLDSDQDDEDEKSDGFISGICSKLASLSPSKKDYNDFRSFSDVGRPITKKKCDRQFSMGY